jgi:quercetin dioxygenase-like cupin family protein
MKTDTLFPHTTNVPLSAGVSLSGFTGEQLMVTHLLFEAGAVGAIHAHPHEQITVVLSGEIEFTLGEESKVLKAGEAVAIPGNMRHGVVARTQAEVLDIFTPIRADLVEKLER